VTDAVIVSAVRTPIGRARKGRLAGVDAFALAEVAVAGAIERAGIPADKLDDIVLAESLQGGGVIARHTAVRLGLAGVPGLAVNRHCAAGLTAVATAAAGVLVGGDRFVVAGGTESLSTSPSSRKRGADGALVDWMSPSHPGTPEAPAFDMSITVGENAAREVGLTRADVDGWALLTHQRAVAAIDEGRFTAEVIPVPIVVDGGPVEFTTDEQPRRDTTAERLASLQVLHPEIPGATVTAGNAGGLNDGAAAVMVTTEERARAAGLVPLGRIVSWASAAVEPVRTGLAPTVAIPKALAKAGLSIGDIEVWEINEAFCSVPLAASRVLGIDPEILNVNGSGCSLGHPIAATGARMVVTMLHELRRRSATLGCVAMCAGGGMGAAMVIEAL
jgi:acetyl-CoA acetyltransferase family protein